MQTDALSPVYVDRRVGSAELYPVLLARGVPVEHTSLEYGDCCFIGHGPDGPLIVGIERKRIGDLLQSMTTGRLSGHQLPGLCQSYEYRWLLVEGQYREGRGGFVEMLRGKEWDTTGVRFTALENFLLTLQLRGGTRVQRTFSIHESAAWIATLFDWWSSKAWHEHRSHLALHDDFDHGLFYKPSLVHRMAAQLPGIDQKAKDIAARFKTPAEMLEAGEAQWREIPGIGKVLASRIYKVLRSSKD